MPEMPKFDFSSTSSFKSDDTLSLSSFDSDNDSNNDSDNDNYFRNIRGGTKGESSSWKMTSYLLIFLLLLSVGGNIYQIIKSKKEKDDSSDKSD